MSEPGVTPDVVAQRLGGKPLALDLLVRLTLAALLSVPFWHAPALVHWGGQGAAQALFSSTLAVWRCKGAFLVYSLAWLAAVSAFGLTIGLLGAITGSTALGLLALPAGLVFSAVFYTSLYFAYIDSFRDDDGTAGQPGG
jgi:hypothetical protein